MVCVIIGVGCRNQFYVGGGGGAASRYMSYTWFMILQLHITRTKTF